MGNASHRSLTGSRRRPRQPPGARDHQRVVRGRPPPRIRRRPPRRPDSGCDRMRHPLRNRSVIRPAPARPPRPGWTSCVGHPLAQISRRFRHHSSTDCPRPEDPSGASPADLHRDANTPQAGQGPSRGVCSIITFTVLASTRWTSKTLNSSSSPNNTDVASDMLVAPLLDVVRDQQHVGATSPSTATTQDATPRSSSKNRKRPSTRTRSPGKGVLQRPPYLLNLRSREGLCISCPS